MVGVQSPFAPVAISNKIAYLTTGSAWMMERTTAERRPLVTSGDLDGYVFSLSPDGKWLLYSRKSSLPVAQEINNLWVISTIDENPKPIDLKTKNVVHFAAWAPGQTNQVYYSTVEPRASAPGWQANNDLFALTFANSGSYIKRDEIIPANSGGVYGWWGTTYAWSPDGKALAYARPDSIGLVNLDKKTTTPLIDLLPYQTRSDWAWVPGLDLVGGSPRAVCDQSPAAGRGSLEGKFADFRSDRFRTGNGPGERADFSGWACFHTRQSPR